MASTPRPFNPEALIPFVVAEVRPPIGIGTVLVRRYTILLPIAQVLADGTNRPVASGQDRVALEIALVDHFGGVTVPANVPVIKGLGARDPQHPEQSQEVNVHTYFLVYAAIHEASDRYFLALKRELEEALVEGVILIERHEVTIL
jgi:hypothetical protein